MPHCRRSLRAIALALLILAAPNSGYSGSESSVAGRTIPESLELEDRRSGTTFLSSALQAQQADEGANPGMLWVETGADLWRTPAGSEGKTCASCHGEAEDSMKGVAARYPVVDKESGDLMNLELRINQCRSEH